MDPDPVSDPDHNDNSGSGSDRIRIHKVLRVKSTFAQLLGSIYEPKRGYLCQISSVASLMRHTDTSWNTDHHMFQENRGNTRQLHADTGTLNILFLKKWNILLGTLIAICSGRAGGILASYMLTQEPLTEFFKEMEHSSRNTDRHLFRESRGNTRQLHADTGTLNIIL